MSSPVSIRPELDATVELAAGVYRLGEPGAERVAPSRRCARPLAGRQRARAPFVEETRRAARPPLAAKLADPLLPTTPPPTSPTPTRPRSAPGPQGGCPTGDEWEAAARGDDERAWPWGDVFDPDRCACAERLGLDGAGRRPPGRRRPVRRRAARGQRLGVGGRPPAHDAWRAVRGGCYLDHGWGLRAAAPCPPIPSAPPPPPAFASPSTQGAARDPGPRHRSPPPCATSTTPAAPTAASASSTWASWRTSTSTAGTSTSTSCSPRLVPVRGVDVRRHPRAPARARRRRERRRPGRLGPRLDARAPVPLGPREAPPAARGAAALPRAAPRQAAAKGA